MIVITGLKNKFLALSKPARYIYGIFIGIFLFLTFKIVGAYFTPPAIERKSEVTERVKGKSTVDLQAGREVKDVAAEQSDQLMALARQADRDDSKAAFDSTGIASENVELADWTDESKLVSSTAKLKEVIEAPEQQYILRDPKSARLPDSLSAIEYELVSKKSAIVNAPQQTFQKSYVPLDTEASAKLVTAMANDLNGLKGDEKLSPGTTESYLTGNTEAYNWEVNKVSPAAVNEQLYQQKLGRYLNTQSTTIAAQSQTSGGAAENTVRLTPNSALGDEVGSSNTNAGIAAEENPLGRGLLPGDILPCKLVFSINSDLSSVSACEVVRGPLRGAIIGLNVQREEEYVTLTSSGITFNDYYDSMSGIAISMEEYGTTGVRSDIDRHTLSRWSALLFAGAFDGVWELYKQPRERTILTDNGIIQTTEEPSDRQVLLAALSRPASILSKTAEKHFDRPNTVYVHRGHLVGVYIQQPFNKEWLPDVSKNSSNIRY